MFLLVTVALGGAAAWMTGRASAAAWDSWWRCGLYLFPLAWAVRFIHFALFGGTLLSLRAYGRDAVVVLIIGLAGFRYRRTAQMTTQYRWLHERTGPFTWRDKTPS